MSAGICIMNKNAIALAADSAVTIGQHLAIHNSANKLFSLSRRAAVGVIIYSNAELMCIPVEIILKQYKSELRDKVFLTLEDYVTDFLGFLITKKDLFHFTSNESSYVRDIYTDLLNGLNGDYQLSIKKKIEEVKRELTNSELKETQKNVVNGTVQFVDDLPVINSEDFYTYIKETYGDEIEEYIKIHFNWIDDSQINTLIDRV